MSTKNASLLKMLIGNGDGKSDFTDKMFQFLRKQNDEPIRKPSFVDSIIKPGISPVKNSKSFERDTEKSKKDKNKDLDSNTEKEPNIRSSVQSAKLEPSGSEGSSRDTSGNKVDSREASGNKVAKEKTEEKTDKSELDKINEIVEMLNKLDYDKNELEFKIDMIELNEENVKDINDVYLIDDDVLDKELSMMMPSDLNDEDSEAVDEYDTYFRESSGKRDSDD